MDSLFASSNNIINHYMNNGISFQYYILWFIKYVLISFGFLIKNKTKNVNKKLL